MQIFACVVVVGSHRQQLVKVTSYGRSPLEGSIFIIFFNFSFEFVVQAVKIKYILTFEAFSSKNLLRLWYVNCATCVVVLILFLIFTPFLNFLQIIVFYRPTVAHLPFKRSTVRHRLNYLSSKKEKWKKYNKFVINTKSTINTNTALQKSMYMHAEYIFKFGSSKKSHLRTRSH